MRNPHKLTVDREWAQACYELLLEAFFEPDLSLGETVSLEARPVFNKLCDYLGKE